MIASRLASAPHKRGRGALALSILKQVDDDGNELPWYRYENEGKQICYEALQTA